MGGTKSKISSIRTCAELTRESEAEDNPSDMCTMISLQTPVTGGGKGASGWFPLSQVNIGYDHAAYMRQEHVLLLDFVNPSINPGARVAVELDLESGKALVAQLQAAIQAAEASGL
jgi:hypothetical protein